MNKIFKVVWSKVRNAYVVVSEIAKNTVSGVGKRNRVKRFSMGATLAAVALTSSFFASNYAEAADSAMVNANTTHYIAVGGASLDTNPFAGIEGVQTSAIDRFNKTITVTFNANDSDPKNDESYVYELKTINYKDINGNSQSATYWIREGFGVKAITERYHPDATQIRLDLYKIPGQKASYDHIAMTGEHVAEITSHYTAVNNVNLDNLVYIQYAGMTNSGGVDVPPNWQYYIKRGEGYVDVGGSTTNFYDNFYVFKENEYNEKTGKYTFAGNDVDYSNVYYVDNDVSDNIPGKIGVFLTDDYDGAFDNPDLLSGSIANAGIGVYGGTVFGKNNEILLSGYDSKTDTWTTVWAGEITDPNATIESMTLSEFNEILHHIHEEDVKLADAGIVSTKVTVGKDTQINTTLGAGTNVVMGSEIDLGLGDGKTKTITSAGSINMVNVAGKQVPGLYVVSSGGTKGNGDDTVITFIDSGAETSVDTNGNITTTQDERSKLTLKTGSVVVANDGATYVEGQNNVLNSLTINGKLYTVPTTNTEGTKTNNITIKNTGTNVNVSAITNETTGNTEYTINAVDTTYSLINNGKNTSTGSTTYDIKNNLTDKVIGSIVDTDTNTRYSISSSLNSKGENVYTFKEDGVALSTITDTNTKTTGVGLAYDASTQKLTLTLTDSDTEVVSGEVIIPAGSGNGNSVVDRYLVGAAVTTGEGSSAVTSYTGDYYVSEAGELQLNVHNGDGVTIKGIASTQALAKLEAKVNDGWVAQVDGQQVKKIGYSDILNFKSGSNVDVSINTDHSINISANDYRLVGNSITTTTTNDSGEEVTTTTYTGEYSVDDGGKVQLNVQNNIDGSISNVTIGNIATKTALDTISGNVNAGWEAQVNGNTAKVVTPGSNTLNFVAGNDNVTLSSEGNEIKISAKDTTYTVISSVRSNEDARNVVQKWAVNESGNQGNPIATIVDTDTKILSGTISDVGSGKYNVILDTNGDDVTIENLHDYYTTSTKVSSIINGARIGFIKNNSSNEAYGIDFIAGGGNNAEGDTYVQIGDGTSNIKLNTGSKVVANGSEEVTDGPLTKLSVNGKVYSVATSSSVNSAAAAAKSEVKAGTNSIDNSVDSNLVKNIDVAKTIGDKGQDIYSISVADMRVVSGIADYSTSKISLTNGDGTVADITGLHDYYATGLDVVAGANGSKDLVLTLNNGDTVEMDLTKITSGLGTMSSWTANANGKNIVVDNDKNVLEFAPGNDNIVVDADISNGKITVATAPDVSFTTVNVGGNVSINQNGVVVENGDNDIVLSKTNVSVGGNRIQNVAAGTADTDVVNVGQLKASRTQVVNGKNTTVTSGINSGTNQVTYTVNAERTTVSTSDSNLTLTRTTNASEFLTNYDIDLNDNITLGSDTNKQININGEDGKLNVGNVVEVSTTGIAMGNQKITGLADGENPNDAVNMSQLNAVSATVNQGWNLNVVTNTNSTNNTNTYKVVPGDSVTLQSANDNLRIANSNGVVTFTAKNDYISTAGFNAETGTLTLGYNNNTMTALSVTGLMSGWTANVNDGNGTSDVPISITNGKVINYIDGKNITLSAVAGTNGGGNITVATKDNVDFQKVTVGAVTIEENTNNSNNSSTVQVGDVIIDSVDGISAGDEVITNVAAGVNDTDAVNVGQLKSVTNSEKHLVVNPADGSDGHYAVANDSVTLKVEGKDSSGITTYTDVVIDDVASARNLAAVKAHTIREFVMTGGTDYGTINLVRENNSVVPGGLTFTSGGGKDIVVVENGSNVEKYPDTHITISNGNSSIVLNTGSVVRANVNVEDATLLTSITVNGQEYIIPRFDVDSSGNVISQDYHIVNGHTPIEYGKDTEGNDVVTKHAYYLAEDGVVGLEVLDRHDTSKREGYVYIANLATKTTQDEHSKLLTGTVMYNKTEDGKGYVYNSIKLGETDNVNDYKGKQGGGVKVTNVAYADGSDGSAAVNVDLLNDRIATVTTQATAAKTTLSETGKNITVGETSNQDGSTKYTVNLNDNITLGDASKTNVNINGTNGSITALTTNSGTVTGKVEINSSNSTITVGNTDNKVVVNGQAGTVNVGTQVTINGTTGDIKAGKVQIDGSGTIMGLSNTEWNTGTDYSNSTKAATEAQIQKAIQNVVSVDVAKAKTEVIAGNNVTVKSSTATDGHTVYTISAFKNSNMSGTGWVDNTNDIQVKVNQTDGTNVSSVSATIQDVAKASNLGDVSQLNADLKQTDNSGAAIHTNVVQAVNKLDDKVNQGWTSTINGSTTVKNVKMGDTQDYKEGSNIKLSADSGSIVVSTAEQVNFTKVTVGSVVVDSDGINAGSKKITNVDNGDVSATSKDAVNGSQLYATNQAVINNYANIQQLQGNDQYLDSRINQLGSKVNKVGAGAAALAALHPMDFDPDDKLSFAVGAGNYAGETATALGAFYRPNEKVMMNVAGTYGNGENMVNMGVSFALDRTNHVSNSRTAMAKEIVDLREQVATQGQQIAQLVALVQQLAGVQQPVVPAEQLFPDVPENHWAYEYVNTLVSKGIIEGYPDGTFGGDRTMTRYEFAAMLFRAMEQGVVLSEQIRQEFEKELGRVRVDRVKGADNDPNKIERVRVNKAADRDNYGSKIVQVKH